MFRPTECLIAMSDNYDERSKSTYSLVDQLQIAMKKISPYYLGPLNISPLNL
jgi:hypothetical protein